MTVAIQLYTVRDQLRADAPRTLARLRAVGFEQVELFDFVDEPDRWAKLLDAAGLVAVSGHAHLVDEDADRALDAAAALGLRYLIEPAVPESRWRSGSDVAEIADSLSRTSIAGRDLGLTIGYHNHAWEISARIGGHTALEELAARSDPGVALEVDLYWAAVGGMPPARLVASLAERVRLIHVKDGVGTSAPDQQVPPGDGDLGILEAVDAARHAMRIVEFDGVRGDLLEAAALSLRRLEVRS